MKKEYWVIIEPGKDPHEIAETVIIPSDETVEHGSYHEVNMDGWFLSETAANDALSSTLSRTESHLQEIQKPNSGWHPDNINFAKEKIVKLKSCRIVKVTVSISVQE